jgi:hypothetical protein
VSARALGAGTRSPSRWLAAGAAALLLVASWLVAFVTPTDAERDAPFVTSMTVGERATGRNLSVTVEAVRLAHAVHTNRWEADGPTLWVVIELSAEAVHDDIRASLLGMTLRVGDRSYRASERPESLWERGLSTGIPTSGVLAFELPQAAATGHGMLDLSLTNDTRVDSVLRLAIDLAALEVEPDIELAPTVWGR